MAYIDTSALVAYYCPEPMSAKIERAILSIAHPHISYLTDVEIASAIARKVRCKEVSFPDGHRIINFYRTHVDKRLYCWLPLDLKHFQVARSWISQFNPAVRTLDALHLAVMASNDLPILSSDNQLLAAAEYFGIQIIPIT